MKSVAIITARGGSKRIPHENLFWNTALKLHLGQTAFRKSWYLQMMKRLQG